MAIGKGNVCGGNVSRACALTLNFIAAGYAFGGPLTDEHLIYDPYSSDACIWKDAKELRGINRKDR